MTQAMNIGDSIKARRQSALSKYAELLRRHDSPQSGDTEAMMELMTTLKISDRDLQLDVAAVNQAHQFEQDQRLPPTVNEDDVIRKEHEEAIRLETIARDASDRARAQRVKFTNLVDENVFRTRMIGEASIELARIKRRRPMAFGQELPTEQENQASRYATQFTRVQQ